MKFNKNYIFSCLAASALVLTAACTNEEGLGTPLSADDYVFGDGSELVTFSLNTEATQSGSRAALTDEQHISDGNQANVLVFAVYVYNGSAYELAPQFKKGGTAFEYADFGKGDGQNAIEIKNWPVTLKFAVDPSKKYKVAFWAQNKDCEAYTTTDLTKLTVNYDDAKNNDEFRDAFCAVSDEFSNSALRKEVVLHRPFAQINVGTTGADYNNILNGENVIPNKAFRYSKITVEGVYSKLDILNDQVSEKTTAEFNWAPLAAYVRYEAKALPAAAVSFPKEEYLKVKLNSGDGELEGYLEAYPTVEYEEGTKKVSKYLSETFKYMSMCYVLVGSPEKEPGATDHPSDKYQSSTVESVKVSFAETAEGKDYNRNVDPEAEGFVEGSNFVEAFSYYVYLKNVPVHRNWRTNILGGLYAPNPDDPDEPDTPEDPDDPTSLFKTSKLCVHLCPIYYNEQYGVFGDNATADKADNTTWVENGTFPFDDDSLHQDNESDHSSSASAGGDEEEEEEEVVPEP